MQPSSTIYLFTLLSLVAPFWTSVPGPSANPPLTSKRSIFSDPLIVQSILLMSELDIMFDTFTLEPKNEPLAQNIKRHLDGLASLLRKIGSGFNEGIYRSEDFAQLRTIYGDYLRSDFSNVLLQFLKSPDRSRKPRLGREFPQLQELPANPKIEATQSTRTLNWIEIFIESVIIPRAYAECQGGNCQQNNQNGNGGGGGEQGKGSSAAEILMGIAMIIQAIQPMVTAAIEAGAEKSIARTNANAQVKMTNITANTSKFLGTQQREIALTQTAVAQEVSRRNNQGVTQRLSLQLAELRDAREDAQANSQRRLMIEQDLNAERIDLAQKQADANLRLAEKTLNAQLTQAGLTGGFSNSRNSGAQLTLSTANPARTSTVSLRGIQTPASQKLPPLTKKEIDLLIKDSTFIAASSPSFEARGSKEDRLALKPNDLPLNKFIPPRSIKNASIRKKDSLTDPIIDKTAEGPALTPAQHYQIHYLARARVLAPRMENSFHNLIRGSTRFTRQYIAEPEMTRISRGAMGSSPVR